MLPLYFARTATFISESGSEDPAAAEERIARFADLFLERKDYLLRRWESADGVQRSLDEQIVTPEGAELAEPAEVLGLPGSTD